MKKLAPDHMLGSERYSEEARAAGPKHLKEVDKPLLLMQVRITETPHGHIHLDVSGNASKEWLPETLVQQRIDITLAPAPKLKTERLHTRIPRQYRGESTENGHLYMMRGKIDLERANIRISRKGTTQNWLRKGIEICKREQRETHRQLRTEPLQRAYSDDQRRNLVPQ